MVSSGVLRLCCTTETKRERERASNAHRHSSCSSLARRRALGSVRERICFVSSGSSCGYTTNLYCTVHERREASMRGNPGGRQAEKGGRLEPSGEETRDLRTRQKVRDPDGTEDVDGPTERLDRQSASDKVLCAKPDHFAHLQQAASKDRGRRQQEREGERTKE